MPARSRRPLLVTGLLAGALSLTALVSPAAADTWSGADPQGDVVGVVLDGHEACDPPTVVDEPEVTEVDVTDLRVRHGRRGIEVVVSIADLPETGARRRLSTVHVDTPGRAFAVDLWKAPRGFPDEDLYREPNWERLQEQAEETGQCLVVVTTRDVRCPGLTTSSDPTSDTLRVSLPRRCVGDPRWIAVGVDSQTFRRSDGAILHDEWRPDGQDDDSWAPYYGEPVPAAAGGAAPGTPAVVPSSSPRERLAGVGPGGPVWLGPAAPTGQ